MLKITVKTSKDTGVVRVEFRGVLYGVGVHGHTLSLYPEIEEITYKTLLKTVRVFRSGGSGRAISMAIKNRIIKLILQELQNYEERN